MVLFFETSTGHTIYMGADKFENEDLIKYGLPTDYWFHVDDMSSAHVYLRLKDGETIETVSRAAIHECSVLVKANSIEGCKKNEVTVIYTPWSNLHKTHDMDVGAIGFHDRKLVVRTHANKEGPLVNKLNKTKVEEFPDLHGAQQAYARKNIVIAREEKKDRIAREKAERVAADEKKRLESYDNVFESAATLSNKDIIGSATDETAKQFEDDFM